MWGCQPISIIPQQDPETHKTPEEDPQPDEPETPPEAVLLKGTVIGTALSIDYDSGKSSTTVNKRENVFDGNFETYFASYDRSRTWVGLDLGTKHIITKVGYSPRVSQESRVVLALIEGANQADFSDALPLAIIKQKGNTRQMDYIDINFSRGVRYVRYVGPNDARCNLAELEFYGYPGDGNDSQFYQLTNLPTVIVNTEKAKDITSKETYLNSNVYIVSEGGKNLLSTSGTGIKGRGNASWGFPKKPYKIHFADKQSPLGAPAHDRKWTLINNYGDKTLMRNILAFEVSRRIGMAYTPFCAPVDVVINGEYQGCYQLCDQVEVGVNRVPAKDGYLIEIDAYNSTEDVYFYSSKGMPVSVHYPDSETITSAQKSFIQTFFGSMETAVFSSNYKDATNGYRKYLDLDSFLQNFIVGEFCGNTDTYWSIYMYKDGSQGKFFSGPSWDYDLSFENDGRTYPINNINDYIYCSKGSVASDAVKQMVTRIVKNDSAAKARLAEIWDQKKDSLADLNNYVDQTAALLEESQELNFKRWPIMNSTVHQNPRVEGSYAGEVNRVKDYISTRLTKFNQLVHK